ncbi:hypothetical protein BH10PSE17_BH10PSE17_25160 [soil metagenome]
MADIQQLQDRLRAYQAALKSAHIVDMPNAAERARVAARLVENPDDAQALTDFARLDKGHAKAAQLTRKQIEALEDRIETVSREIADAEQAQRNEASQSQRREAVLMSKQMIKRAEAFDCAAEAFVEASKAFFDGHRSVAPAIASVARSLYPDPHKYGDAMATIGPSAKASTSNHAAAVAGVFQKVYAMVLDTESLSLYLTLTDHAPTLKNTMTEAATAATKHLAHRLGVA